jgi:Uma2 family endonuclease
MEATGVWAGQHLELVEGELIDKMGKNQPHVITLVAVLRWMMQAFGDSHVLPEASIDVAPEDNPTSAPEPDITVLTRPVTEFPVDKPKPADLRLVIEISDSTVGFDLKTKADLYARACIVEYWVFDIPQRRLIVHREPQNGLYRSTTAYNSPEAVAPLTLPGCEFRVAEAFPF